MTDTPWIKASRSNDQGNCVEQRRHGGQELLENDLAMAEPGGGVDLVEQRAELRIQIIHRSSLA